VGSAKVRSEPTTPDEQRPGRVDDVTIAKNPPIADLVHMPDEKKFEVQFRKPDGRPTEPWICLRQFQRIKR
jgi:hypothetical protein